MRRTDGKKRILWMVAMLLVALLPALAGVSAGAATTQEPQPQEQAAAAATATSPQKHVWLDAKGSPLPFQTEDEIVNFLTTAKIKKMKEIGTGITVPMKALLEKDGVQMNAKFTHIQQEKAKAEMATGIEMGFRDDYQFEVGAYELARLLGLRNVPPTVKRKGWDPSGTSKNGSMQIWVEKVFTEFDRKMKTKVDPPDQTRWNYQMWEMHVFDALIQNTDRSLPNVLIDPDWKVWMIDHTRAFRRNPKVENLNLLQHCERSLFEKLRTLDEGTVRARLKDYVRSGEIDALLKRRAELVAHFEQLIQEKGEGAVLYTFNE
ncbi:MAG: hypothetical protein ACRD35_04610 [Candidatus Acidiferrales bacterium]